MNFPTRAGAHVMETASWRRLESSLPDRWIVRHATERDYGVDCLVEPVEIDGAVRGDLLAIQLKSTDSLNWTETAGTNPLGAFATYSGIAVTTVNYWMGLPVPVILCVHERSSDAIYFVAVKREVRRSYSLLTSQQTFGFQLRRGLSLSDPDGVPLLYMAYVQEQSFQNFATASGDLLAHRQEYADHIEFNAGRDSFMEVELPDLVMLFRLLRNVSTVVSYSGWAGSLPDVRSLIADDQRLSGDQTCLMHEGTHTRILRELIPGFLEALGVAQKILTVDEREFWSQKEWVLVKFAEQHFDGGWLRRLALRLSPG